MFALNIGMRADWTAASLQGQGPIAFEKGFEDRCNEAIVLSPYALDPALATSYKTGFITADDVLRREGGSSPNPTVSAGQNDVYEFFARCSCLMRAARVSEPLDFFVQGLSAATVTDDDVSLTLAALFDNHISDPVVMRAMEAPAILALCCALRRGSYGVDDNDVLGRTLDDLMDNAPDATVTPLLAECVKCLQICFDPRVLRSAYATNAVPSLGDCILFRAIRRLGERAGVGPIAPCKAEYARSAVADGWSPGAVADAACDPRYEGTNFARHFWTVYVPGLYRTRAEKPSPLHFCAAVDADVPLTPLLASAVLSGYDPREWGRGIDVAGVEAMMDAVDAMLALCFRAAEMLPASIMIDIVRRAGWPVSLIVFYAEYADDCRAVDSDM